LASGADPRSRIAWHHPLYLACENANPAIIERLIKAGADPN
jgi:ankyrin repeat protein